MKNFKTYFILLSLVLIFSCSKETLTEGSPSNSNPNNIQNIQVKQDELQVTYEQLSSQDKIKVLVSEAASNFLLEDSDFNEEFFSKLINSEFKTKEFIYIKEKDQNISNSQTLEEMLLLYFEDNETKLNLIKSINTILPNLVIKIPEWTEVLLNRTDLDLEFAVYPCISKYRSNPIFFFQKGNTFKQQNQGNIVSNYIPIQVEESERLIPVSKTSNETIWKDDLVADHFPSLDGCSNFNKQNYTTHSNEDFDFIDKISLNEDLMNAKLCTSKINTSKATNNDCDITYERDCRNEKNVIEGFKLANTDVFTGINNQPGGEDVMSIHYNFVVASMCGDLKQTEICPPSNWKFVFFGTFNDFFELQLHVGRPTIAEQNDLIFVGSNYYVKAFPKYYDIPFDQSVEQIYSQLRYLQLTPNSSWDGNEYGDAISFGIHEHDDVLVENTNTYSIEVSNSTKISLKLPLGEKFTIGGDFSNSVKRTSTYKYTIEADKDVELGKIVINYYDENYSFPDGGYGAFHSTGSIATHFAFYY